MEKYARSEIINIAEKISPHLALRDMADAFFNWLEKLPCESATLDFNGVQSISRSFAHQYIQRKAKSNKVIKEINMPSNVSKMLDIVENQKPRSPLLDLNSIEVINL